MLKYLIHLTALFCFTMLSAEPLFEATKDLPVAYQGRFRSMESASRLWLYDIYHKQQLKKNDVPLFHAQNPSALDLLWKIHFFGHSEWDDSPFFWIHYASVKSLLGLNQLMDRFSYNDLYRSLHETQETNLSAMKSLILPEFAKQYDEANLRSKRSKIELENLSKGLWIILKNNQLIIGKSPQNPPWHFLKEDMVIAENAQSEMQRFGKGKNNTADELTQLLQQLNTYIHYQDVTGDFQRSFEDLYLKLKNEGMPPKEIAQILESQFPFNKRLQQAGSTLKMLPAKFTPGEWVSLHAFKIKIYDQTRNELILANNFTSFSNENFLQLRNAYTNLERAILTNQAESTKAIEQFASDYNVAYASIAGKPYKPGKLLTYPSELRLKAETLYYQLPLIEATLFFYVLALILMVNTSKTTLTLMALITGFCIHTTVLAFRCYILERPPVSNMFETVVYVPWIAVAIGLIFYSISRSRTVLASAIFASSILLLLLKLTQVDSRLENVQAVLDSQYWLIIHVLMVVASYGAFVISGILGHAYLINNAINRRQKNDSLSSKMAKGILHTMYVGVALLIPGTILGGVWAAESWGRFWDWDPKESWAFISACIYLLFIHAYTFHHIRDFGLAIGAVAGLVAISFTWYGVNYVLGTGLHSYGFGTGGEWLYFMYVGVEFLFIFSMIILNRHYYIKST